MAFPADEQTEGTTNAATDAAAITAGSTAVPVKPVSIASQPTFVSATPQQLSASKDVYLYINVTTAASLTISMGPTSTGTGVALNSAESDALGMVTIRVPAGWYVKITGTVADLNINAVQV